jgi:hypothetical protein
VIVDPDGDNGAEVYLRCRSGVPCDEYTAEMQASARLRRLGDEESAQARAFGARWHRYEALHPLRGDRAAS